MFDWLRRLFQRSDDEERQQFFKTIDEINAETEGGNPISVTRSLGSLKLHSGTLVLGDPQFVHNFEIPNIGVDEVNIAASLWQYPSCGAKVIALRLSFSEPTVNAVQRIVGQVGIDSAKIFVADLADIDEHWTRTGKDRIGVILTPQGDQVLQLLTKRFKLKTRRIHGMRAETVEPVSLELEAEIESYLKRDPKYRDDHYMHFYVQTNSSFDRVNHMSEAWKFIPVGNEPEPLMFVCGTGRGDGLYDVQGIYDGPILRELCVNFIED